MISTPTTSTSSRPANATGALPAVRQEVRIVNERGMTMSACQRLIAHFKSYSGRVTISNGNVVVDGRSMVGMMRLAARAGTVLTIELVGPGAEQMMQSIAPLVANGI
jgi:phosphotransferase system HPr (HPr) family protein